jgi:hypothetical protein
VAGAGEQDLPRQVRRVDFRLVRVGVEFDHRVLVAGNERRRGPVSRRLETRSVPGAIDVAIPVEPARSRQLP